MDDRMDQFTTAQLGEQLARKDLYGDWYYTPMYRDQLRKVIDYRGRIK